MYEKIKKNDRGFTLVELLVAMVVTSIVLTAISTLAFALSSANKSTGDFRRTQTQVRLTTLRIQELIRNCNLICSASDNDIAVWRSDDNCDNKINIGEVVFIECGSGNDHLRLYTFPSEDVSEIEPGSIGAFSTNWWSLYSSNEETVELLPECANVSFRFDTLPPNSRFVNITFDIAENNTVRKYQINAALRSQKGNLLDESGCIISDDD